MQRNDWLKRAGDYVYHTEPLDAAAQLSVANMKYGLAKMHVVQHSLGLEPNATFIASPDVTVTINSYRWQRGFTYGGKLAWGDGDTDLVFLDSKPNCCGMLVGGLDELPSKNDVVARAVKMKQETSTLDGIKIKWNLDKGNHFVDVFEVRERGSKKKLPPYAFMAHTSGSELKKESHLGPGLYIDSSKVLKEWAEVLKTPFGDTPVLTGSKAADYYAFHQRAEDFAHRRRLLAGELLFGEFEPIVNATHQGLVHANEIALGVNFYRTNNGDGSGGPYPLALQPDLPSYLMAPKPSFSKAIIEKLGWGKRARKQGVTGRLEHANFLPHGAGYRFPQIEKLVAVHDIEGRRLFEVKSKRGEGVEVMEELSNIPFEYRGEDVLDQTRALGLGEPVAELVPLYVFKV